MAPHASPIPTYTALAPLSIGGEVMHKKKRRCFFKKKTKNFHPLRVLPASSRQQVKSLLLLFFRK
jgi:hypothetical protein